MLSDWVSSNFTQKLDHFNSTEERNFSQRMWVHDKFYDSRKGIVFLSICGEWTCQPMAEAGWPHRVAAALKAKIIVLEHRYYGASQPFDTWTNSNLRYLNSTQALADIAHFIEVQNINI
jgi:hypothetical protein